MSYTASDLRAVGGGFLLFGRFAFAPGYTFGWLSNVLQFRQRRLITRLGAAVPLSIGLVPIVSYYLWRWWLPLAWVTCAACGAAGAILLIPDVLANKLRLSRAGWLVLAIAAGWLVVATFSLIDLQIGDRLYFSFSSYDHGTRTAFKAALAAGLIGLVLTWHAANHSGPPEAMAGTTLNLQSSNRPDALPVPSFGKAASFQN